jgi:hypothetical protein
MTKSNPTDPREKYWDMYQILGGYFHQDYDSFDQGLAEFLQNNVQSKEKSLIKIRGFLASDNQAIRRTQLRVLQSRTSLLARRLCEKNRRKSTGRKEVNIISG